MATPTAFEPGLLQDAHRLHGRAVDARERRHVLEAVLDERDVAEVHRRLMPALRMTMLRSVVEVGGLAEDAHVERAAAVVELAARRRDVLLLDARVDDVASRVTPVATSLSASTQMRTLRSR